MKLSDEDKREIIRLNKEEGVSQTHLAEAFGVGVRHIADLIARYNLHGEEVLIKKSYRKYSPEFKMEVIHRYLGGEAKNALAVEYVIKRSMIDSWLRRYEKGGYNGLIDKKKGRPPKMKKDKELEAEVAYLKKLNALVRERKKRESKKK